MFFKEKRKKVDLYLSTEEKLNKKLEKLHEVEEKLNSTNNELDEVNNKLQLSKEELEKYKREALEVKDYVDSKFLEDYKDSKRLLDINDCYIIEKNNKKYITRRYKELEDLGFGTIRGGSVYCEKFFYYDLLYLNGYETGVLKSCVCIYIVVRDTKNYKKKTRGDVPTEEKHILEVFPELRFFPDGMVPEECLKKAYYEVNDLGSIDKSKILIKK